MGASASVGRDRRGASSASIMSSNTPPQSRSTSQQEHYTPPVLKLTRAGPLRLLDAARLALESLGETEEAMDLAESALALMFG